MKESHERDLTVQKIEREIKEKLKENSKKYPIRISSINVLKDVTVIFDPEDSQFKMIFGDADQDIVVYLDPDKHKIEVPQGRY